MSPLPALLRILLCLGLLLNGAGLPAAAHAHGADAVATAAQDCHRQEAAHDADIRAGADMPSCCEAPGCNCHCSHTAQVALSGIQPAPAIPGAAPLQPQAGERLPPPLPREQRPPIA